LVEVDGGGAVSSHAVDLEVGEQDLRPAEPEYGRNGFVDLLDDAVEAGVLLDDVAGAVAGGIDHEVMPGVGGPFLRIAGSGGVEPLVDGVVGAACVGCVVPGSLFLTPLWGWA
jgi:hypothetical protein